ncbi:hypothetical protein F53441_5994 [Fusarium austroafricanum]|uniref:DUF4345 domain-containing protein n=1 Tax=Fusarium austroafricanum TaxID=2364996 RepID=A0A8H4NZ33_9HYPO|nr:hypothetical protein F53441_5994 [Fusarium austroafricanum]
MSEHGSSRFLSTGLKAFAIFSMFTGTVDIITGHKVLLPTSERAQLSESTLGLLDNQLRFLAASWGGYGGMLWWASNNLQTRQAPLGFLGAIMFVAGIGRLLGGLTVGWGASWTKVAATIELVFPPLIYLFVF